MDLHLRHELLVGFEGIEFGHFGDALVVFAALDDSLRLLLSEEVENVRPNTRISNTNVELLADPIEQVLSRVAVHVT